MIETTNRTWKYTNKQFLNNFYKIHEEIMENGKYGKNNKNRT